MVSDNQRGWVDVLTIVTSAVDDDNLPLCPRCGQQRVDYAYMGDSKSRIGFLVMWCDACRHGVRISRAKAPANVHFMPFSDRNAFAARVPTFTEIPLTGSEETEPD